MKWLVPIIGVIISVSALIFRLIEIHSSGGSFLEPGLAYLLTVAGLVFAILGLGLDDY